MERISRILLITSMTSILLPYGIITTSTISMAINQYWLFPLWTYLHDFGNWLGFGIIIPPILPTFSFLQLVIGLILCVLGFYIAIILNQYYRGKREAKSVWQPTIGLLVLQVMVVALFSFTIGYGMTFFSIPLPLHCLLVLSLVRFQIKKINNAATPFE